jgi:ribosomal protein L37AE/L43A
MSYSDDTAEYLFTGEPSMRTLRNEIEQQMKNNHSCKQCGKEYKSNTKDQYCSMLCRYDARQDAADSMRT